MEKKIDIMVIVVAALVFCCVSVSSVGQERDIIIDDVTIPLEWHDNGKVKTQLFAESAKMMGGNKDIDALAPKIEFYDEAGKTQAVMTAENCLYNKKEQVITTGSKVKLEQAGVIITGTGLEWISEGQIVKILDNVKVIIKKGLEPVKKK